jgi:hypothetical protein
MLPGSDLSFGFFSFERKEKEQPTKIDTAYSRS